MRTLFLLATFLGCAVASGEESAPPKTLTLLIGCDGLRPDYVTTELMPNLAALSAEGVFFENHHSVYPTVTRVNVTSIVTGCYPAKHGLMDNTIYIPEAGLQTIDTSEVESLRKVDGATGGKLLLAPTLGELLEASGKKLLAVSSGSSGSAFLLNARGRGCGIIHPEFTIPPTLLAQVDTLLGPPPPAAVPNTAWMNRAVDALLKIGLDELKPDVVVIWLTDPDHTAHLQGIGDPKTVEALKATDTAIGNLLEGLKARGLRASTNILVCSDHGFSTHRGAQPSGKTVVRKIVGEAGGDPEQLVMAGYGVYLEGKNKPLAPEVAKRLQRETWVGALFMRPAEPGLPLGAVPGTLSFDAINYNNGRSPDIVVAPDWSDEANEHGYKGTTFVGGKAGHGSSSVWDIHNTFVANGPAFKRAQRSAAPTCNVDIAPTILKLHGIEPPKTMDGRIVEEALVNGADAAGAAPAAQETVAKAEFPEGGGFETTLHQTRYGNAVYFDKTVARHIAAPAAGK